MKNPIQPLVTDEGGILRFKQNILVNALLEHGRQTGFGLNELRVKFGASEHDDDYQQLSQLIGYSLSGYGYLSFVDNVAYEAANAMHHAGVPETQARIDALGRELKELREGLSMAYETLSELLGQ